MAVETRVFLAIEAFRWKSGIQFALRDAVSLPWWQCLI